MYKNNIIIINSPNIDKITTQKKTKFLLNSILEPKTQILQKVCKGNNTVKLFKFIFRLLGEIGLIYIGLYFLV